MSVSTRMEQYNKLCLRFKNGEKYMDKELSKKDMQIARNTLIKVGTEMERYLSFFGLHGIRVTDKEAYNGFSKERMAKYK